MGYKFSIGAAVVLKTGGPTMIVRGYNGANLSGSEKMVDCDWFDVSELRQSATFHEDQLTFPDDKPFEKSYIVC